MSKFEFKQNMIGFPPDTLPVIVKFDVIEELLAVDLLKQYAQQSNFKQFSLFRTAVIVELTDDTTITAGIIRNSQGLPWDMYGLTLPLWDPPRKPRES